MKTIKALCLGLAITVHFAGNTVEAKASEPSTTEILSTLISNASTIVIAGDLQGQSVATILAEYMNTNLHKAQGEGVVLNSVTSACDEKSNGELECGLTLYSEAAVTTRSGYKKSEIGESAIILQVTFRKQNGKFIFTGSPVKSSLAG